MKSDDEPEISKEVPAKQRRLPTTIAVLFFVILAVYLVARAPRRNTSSIRSDLIFGNDSGFLAEFPTFAIVYGAGRPAFMTELRAHGGEL